MNVTKSTIEVYKIRDEQDIIGWADISIDAGWLESGHGKQNCFRVSISSDYGNWAFFWSHPGDCWRAFASKIDIHYAAGKFGCSDWFDVDKTEKDLKYAIVQQRKEGGSTKVEARSAWIAIDDAVGEYGRSKDLICNSLIQSDWAEFWGDGWYDMLNMSATIEPGFKAFWDGPWQAFLEEIKTEIITS